MSDHRCEVCGQRVRLNASDEGTCSYDGIAEKELEQSQSRVAMLQESLSALVLEVIYGPISEVVNCHKNAPELRFKDRMVLYNRAKVMNDLCLESLNVLANTPADCMKQIEARVLRYAAASLDKIRRGYAGSKTDAHLEGVLYAIGELERMAEEREK